MSTKLDPLGVKCHLHRLDNGRIAVQMRGAGSHHSDGEYSGRGRFTVERTPTRDIVRARPHEDEEGADEAAQPASVQPVEIVLTSFINDELGGIDSAWLLSNAVTGTVYWLVITASADVLRDPVLHEGNFTAGTTGGWYDPIAMAPYLVTANLYTDSGLATLVATATTNAV